MTKNLKKLFCVLLSALLIAGALPFVALPEAMAADVWDGTWDGSGFSGNHITSAKGLAQFINNAGTGTSYSGQTVYLDVDIDLNGIDFGNISGGKNVYYSRDNYFQGTFDGQGHTIANFQMHNSDHRVGLFRSASNATFKNVTFTNVFIDDNDNGNKKNGFAAVVGYGEGNLTFENVHVQSGTVYGYNYVGGLVGEYGANETLKLTNCSNGARIYADNDRAAGMVGHSKGRVQATDCSNTGEIYAGYSDAGGIAGWIEDDESYFVNCSNTGKVSTDACAGGIFGYFGSKSNDNKMTVTGCSNTGYIESRAKVAGGIAGMTDTDGAHIFENNVNRGDVYGKEDAGGILGSNIGSGVWRNNKNYGNVRCDNDNAGGICGDVEDDVQKFYNCCNSGTVTGKNSVGGIFGYGQNANHEFYDCGNSGAVTATSDCAGGIYGYGNESEPTLEQCWNISAVNAYNDAGGILGRTYHHSYIRRCFNAGAIGTYNNNNNGAHGGIAGQTSDKSGSSNDNPNMTDCVNWGSVSGGRDDGGLIGKIKDGRTPYYITNSYNAGQVTGDRPFAIISYGGNVGNNVYYYNGVAMGTIQGNSIGDSDLKASSGFSGNYCKNTWGVKIGATTYYYPILNWYRDRFVFHLKFVDAPSGTNAYFDGNYGAGFTAPNPARTGYTIGDWYAENDANRKMTPNTLIWCGTSAPTDTMTVTQSLTDVTDISNTTTFNLSWTPHTYSIVFNRNGMNYGSMDPLPMVYDTAKDLPAVGFFREYSVTLKFMDGASTDQTTAVRSDFNGWATSATGAVVYGDKQNVNNLTAENNGTVNLYANWTSGSMELPVPTREGYTFTGWYTDEACSPGYKVNGSTYYPTENKTLYAGWTRNTYTVTFLNESGQVLKSQTVSHGDTPTPPAVPAKAPTAEGHYVGAWNSAIVPATGPATYQAVYSLTAHTGGTADCQHKKVCEVCNTQYGGFGGHVLTEVPADAPACLAPGHVAYWHCAVCGSDFADAAGTAGLAAYQAGHTYGELIAEVPATCEDAGVIAHYTCAVCGKDFDAEKNPVSDLSIPAKGHAYGALIAGVPAKCEEAGVIAHYHCADCGKDFDAEKNPVNDLTVPAAGHSYGELIAEVPAKCEEAGAIAHYHCAACGKDFDAEKNPVSDLSIPAAGHTWGELIAEVPAKCEEAGVIAHYHCAACGKDFDAEKNPAADLVIPAAGHIYGELIAGTPAKCEEAGTADHYHCAVCGKDFDAEHNLLTDLNIPAAGHAYGSLIAEVPAKCEEAGVIAHYHCAVCGKDFDAEKNAVDTLVIPAIGSHTLILVPAKEAGCPNTTGNGSIEYRRCAVCGKCFADEAGETEISVASTVIPAAHRPVYVGEIPATATEAGVKAHFDCELCGRHYADRNCTAELSDEDLVISPVPAEEDAGQSVHVCPLCGRRHGTTVYERIAEIVHLIVYVVVSFFKK